MSNVTARKGSRITGPQRAELTEEVCTQVPGRGVDPFAGRRNRPLVRLRARIVRRWKRPVARPRRSDPAQAECRMTFAAGSTTTLSTGAASGSRSTPPLAVLTLDRPEALNAQTPATWVALNHAVDLLPAKVRVVIVTGAGRAFSAGLDRAVWTDGPCAAIGDLPDPLALDRIARTSTRSAGSTEPDRITIAAVRGPAVGAGFQLALACHLIVAADDAVFSLFEVTLGLVPDLGGIGRLARSVGERRTLELAATGRRLGRGRGGQLGSGDPGGSGGPARCGRAGVGGRAAGQSRSLRCRRSPSWSTAPPYREPLSSCCASAAAQLPLLRALNAADRSGFSGGVPKSLRPAQVATWASADCLGSGSQSARKGTLQQQVSIDPGGSTPSECPPPSRVAQNASPISAGAWRSSRLACSRSASCCARRRRSSGRGPRARSSRCPVGRVIPVVRAGGERELRPDRGWRRLVPGQRAQHVEREHVAGALPDRVQRRLAEQPRQTRLLDVAVAAEAFQRLGDDGRRALADPELRGRDGQSQERRLAVVDGVGQPQPERGRRLHLERQVGQHRRASPARRPAGPRTPTDAECGGWPAPGPRAAHRRSRARSPAGSSSPSAGSPERRGQVHRSASRRCPRTPPPPTRSTGCRACPSAAAAGTGCARRCCRAAPAGRGSTSGPSSSWASTRNRSFIGAEQNHLCPVIR